MINSGIVLDTGTEKPITLPYTACVAGYCEAIANLAPDFIDTLLSAEEATATINSISGKPLIFSISVDGLVDAITALKFRRGQG